MSAFELELTVCAGGKGHVTTTIAVATAAELESLAETTAAAIKSWQDEREHKGESVEQLVASRDRWRARASVTDADCQRAGITWEHVDAFMREVYPGWVGKRCLAMADMIGRRWGGRCPQDNLDRCAAALDGAK